MQQQQLTRNQKKKRRQKLSKKFKALAFSAVQQQEPQPDPCADSELGQASSWDEQEPPTKRAKQAAPPGSSSPTPSQAAQQKLSVSTFPGADRRAQGSIQQAATAEPAARQPEPQQQQQQQQQQVVTGPLAQLAEMSRRLDLSHAAALIHSELLGTARLGAAATAATAATASPLPAHSCSPAASGCCAGGAGCTAGPAGVGAGGPTLVYQAASIVTSTDTSAAAGTAWAVSGALGPSSAQHAQHGSGDGGGGATSRQPATGIVGSDCEGEGCGSEDYGQAGEDAEDIHAAAASAGIEEQGGSGGPERRGQGQGQGGPLQRAYVHGNYRRYYGYRLGQAFGGDPRLQCFERSWFANRRCLDVGCNEGLVTLALATRFGCRSMMGVDIDEHLVRKACMHLREERSRAGVRVVGVRRGGTPASERRAAHVAHAALAQTWFVHADFVESSGEDGSFDTITCLSVVKWVHLNRGDAGLEAMLSKFWRLLAPGGLLLLEPQPWKSYKAAAGKLRKQAQAPTTYFKRLEELQLRPETLPDLLVDKLGFRLVKRLQPPSDAATGFDRPMFLFRKPA